MITKATKLCLPIVLALISLALVTGALAQGPDRVSDAAPEAGAPVVTATIQFVDAGRALLASPPVYRRTISDTRPLTISIRSMPAATLPLQVEVDSFSLQVGGGPLLVSFSITPTSLTLTAEAEVQDIGISYSAGAMPPGSYAGQIGFRVSPIMSATSTATPPATATVTQPGPLSGTAVTPATAPTSTPAGAAAGAASFSFTEPFTLVVSAWPAELAWAQDNFTYVIDTGQISYTTAVRAIARFGQAEQVHLTLEQLTGGGAGQATALRTTGLVAAGPSRRITSGLVATFPITIDASVLPGPGPYTGVLRLSADNAAPITTTITLLAPDRARGSYQLVVGELGATAGITTSAQPITTALQFSGVRLWPFVLEPGHWPAAAQSWYLAVWSVLLALGLGVILGYAAWMLWPTKNTLARIAIFGSIGVIALVVGAGFFLYASQPGHEPILVNQRQLLIWEAHGQGPVRELTASGGTVVNQAGYEGQVALAVAGAPLTDTGAGAPLTGRVDLPGLDRVHVVNQLTITEITGLWQPGVYQGRLLIQSPNIANGLVEVPLQVTVHDLPVWAALAILLGVAAGGISKFLSEPAGQRLDQRLALVKARGKWNATMADIPGGLVAPIYIRILERINGANQLLDQDTEWGVPAAKATVQAIEDDLIQFDDLNSRLSRIQEEMSLIRHTPAMTELEAANRRFKDALAQARGETVPPSVKEDRQRRIHALVESMKTIEGTASELNKEWERWIAAFEKDLEAGNLAQAAQRWTDDINNGLVVMLHREQARLKKLQGEDKSSDERLKEAADAQNAASEYLGLKGTAPTAGALAMAWSLVINASAFMEAYGLDQLTFKLNTLPVTSVPTESGQPAADLNQAPGEGTPTREVTTGRSVSRVALSPQLVVASRDQLLWLDEAASGPTRSVKATLLVRVNGFPAEAIPDHLNWTAEAQGKSLEVQPQYQPNPKIPDEFRLSIPVPLDQWDGDPLDCKITATYNKGGDGGPVSASVEATIDSAYEIVATPQRLVADEISLFEAHWRGPGPRPKNHTQFDWYLNDSHRPKSGALPIVAFKINPAGDRKADIRLSVSSSGPGGNQQPVLVQKAHFFQLAQKSSLDELARDKRRLNLSRQVFAALLALVGGILANRVFGVTFGSPADYLLAFAWGVGVNFGVDPTLESITGVSAGFREALKSLANRTASQPPTPPGGGGPS